MFNRRLRNNNLKCDCKLIWLSKWLSNHSNLAIETKCYVSHKKQIELVNLKDEDFNCNRYDTGNSHL